ncbi:MAG: hypothetical protein WC959_12710 [Kiritimatiellales bacterium]
MDKNTTRLSDLKSWLKDAAQEFSSAESFVNKHNDPHLKHVCLARAVATNEFSFLPDFSPKWAFARRGFLKIFDTYLTFGNWIIHYPDIESAKLKIRSSGDFLFQGHILIIKTAVRVYQFGLPENKFWETKMPFDFERV